MKECGKQHGSGRQRAIRREARQAGSVGRHDATRRGLRSSGVEHRSGVRIMFMWRHEVHVFPPRSAFARGVLRLQENANMVTGGGVEWRPSGAMRSARAAKGIVQQVANRMPRLSPADTVPGG